MELNTTWRHEIEAEIEEKMKKLKEIEAKEQNKLQNRTLDETIIQKAKLFDKMMDFLIYEAALNKNEKAAKIYSKIINKVTFEINQSQR
jgi:hypothetical protein